ncbi:MAG: guanylate kinase [Campylobacteraceae bacterium]|jgi:guanylate kinase|nr:guanylate kinase [Campylobacteraceae bacterium]MBT3882705.1 guanylate kinase [Campylobacteraceae bacterium]MBT4030431.1 guanylate kinase [Campylobacteraceae bacterium]MBT4178996.1 guanylate kinase [Campylobacteraceae bacterium]MBT4573005.1 guanylate kinase [Campylobacteraceae bacterium]
MNNLLNKGSIIVISGPSGCGKSSLLKEVYKYIDNYYFSISTTTRQIRDGESNGIDYHFVSKEEFEKDIEAGNFLEWAQVHGNYYGTSLKLITEALELKKIVIFDIDVQGHDIVREKLDAITTSVFITTPSLDELSNRLTSRATDTDEVINNRIKNSKIEIQKIQKYDYFIINDNLELASKQLLNVIECSKIKTSLFDKDMIIEKWLSN